MERYPEVETHIASLFMQNRAIGRHAGGVLVADPEHLETTMPIVGVRGELQTPWSEGLNFRNLEDNGFIKFDFLGLSLLKDIENCIYKILKKQGNKNPTFSDAKEFFDKHLNCRFHDQNDQEVWKHVYHDGRFVGIFQFTNSGARNFSLEAKPENIEELAALTAIYRPGPLKANVHKKYVKSKQNADQIKYDHPIIEEVLGPTFSYVVFQEQFMLLAQKLSGFDPGEADKLRKTLVKNNLATMGNKKDEKSIAREKFIKGAKEINDVPEHISRKLWEEIEGFAVYGFNKSLLSNTLIDTYDHEGNYLSTKEIKDVVPGVYVKTRDEESKEDIFTQVLSNHDHGEVPTFKITLEDGQSVECTMHHKFRVEDGRMLPLWFIIQEDLSIVCAEKAM
jgi:DNA polymerase III alpha subunit